MATDVKRTAERVEFLGDIITGAIEGGIGYWSACSQYQWVDRDGKVRVSVGRVLGDEPRAIIHVIRDDETGYEDEGLALTLDAVSRGLRLIREGGCEINSRLKKAIMLADRSNDAGQLDAFDCDVIVQAGVLGEIVYA